MSSYEDADTDSDKEAYGNKAEKRLHMVAHTYSPGILRTGELRQEDSQEFKNSLSDIESSGPVRASE